MKARELTKFEWYLVLLVMAALTGCGGGSDSDNGTDNPAQTIEVAGNAAWTNTNITVAAGATLTLTATGSVSYDSVGDSCGPEGADWTDEMFGEQNDPLWAKPHAGLIMKIGEAGTPLWVGASLTLQAGSGGVLYLGVNDVDFDTNSGKFTVKVVVTSPAN
jgi:hypothetical protein